MNEETVEITEEDIESSVTSEYVSPYALAKIESELRKITVPPQKVYGYIRNGYLKATKSSTDKLQVSKEESIRYLTKQVLKK